MKNSLGVRFGLSLALAWGAAGATIALAATPAVAASVVNVGGVFIFANNMESLASWYTQKTGITMTYNEKEDDWFHVFAYGDFRKGESVAFSIFPKGYDRKPLRMSPDLPSERNLTMVNFRVDDFDGFKKSLIEHGVDVEKRVDVFCFGQTEQGAKVGKFGWFRDLERNPVEFWAMVLMKECPKP